MLSSPASLGKSICGERKVCVSKSHKETDNCQMTRNVTEMYEYAMMPLAPDCSMQRDRAGIKHA